MVKVAEAPSGVVVVVPLGVQLLDAVERVLAQLDVVRGCATPVVLVRGDVSSERLHIAETISGHHDVSTLALNYLRRQKVKVCNQNCTVSTCQ